MKNKLAKLFSWALTLSYSLFPTQSYAVTVANELEHKDTDKLNVRKEIRWTKSLSKYYARALISAQYETWGASEFRALKKLWGKESAWNPEADNPESTAFGVPQILGMNPLTPAPRQVERGLAYIQHRYGKPSVAWSHWRINGWY